jgi:hypothetical protein
VTRRTDHHGALDSLRHGFRVAARRPGVVTAIWGWHLVLGFALALPMFRWLYAATAYRPEADALAERFSIGGLIDLLQFDSAPILRIMNTAVAGGLLVAVFASPLLLAATLASVRDASRDRRELGAAAAALYWPFLLVIVIGRAVSGAAAGLTAALAGLALTPLSRSAWEPGFLWAAVIQAGTAVLVAVLLLAAVDYALVRLEAGRSPGALSAWLAGVREAVTRPGLTLGMWAGAGSVLALAVGVYATLREFTSRGAVGAPSVVALGVAFVLQQAFMFTRTWLRVGLLAAEQDASGRLGQGGGRAPETAPGQAIDGQPDGAQNVDRQHHAHQDDRHGERTHEPQAQQLTIDRRQAGEDEGRCCHSAGDDVCKHRVRLC